MTVSAASRKAVLGTVRGALRYAGTEGQTFFAVVGFLEATLAGERTRTTISWAFSAGVRNRSSALRICYQRSGLTVYGCKELVLVVHA